MDYDLRLWTFVADMNSDGAVTISDVWLWFKWLYFYPGDGMLYVAMKSTPALAQFFEMSSMSYGGGLSGTVSFFTWLTVLGVAASALEQTAR